MERKGPMVLKWVDLETVAREILEFRPGCFPKSLKINGSRLGGKTFRPGVWVETGPQVGVEVRNRRTSRILRDSWSYPFRGTVSGLCAQQPEVF